MALPSINDAIESSPILSEIPWTNPVFIIFIFIGFFLPTIIIAVKSPKYAMLAFQKNALALLCVLSVIGIPIGLKIILDLQALKGEDVSGDTQ